MSKAVSKAVSKTVGKTVSKAATNALSNRASQAVPPKVCRGLRPIVGVAPRVLILGSMPGQESLRRRQYYAHPQNQFWRILGVLCGAAPELPYAERLIRLMRARIAVWDTAKVCMRVASSDASIADVQLNDFKTLLRAQPTIERIYCNGSKSYEMFMRLVAPTLAGAGAGLGSTLPVVRLPSTSPAHASLSYAQKLVRWRAELLPIKRKRAQ